LATDDTAPTFGLWYDFRQKPPLGDYVSFYAVAIRPDDLPWERHFVGDLVEVADGLARLHAEAPYDHSCFWSRLPGISHEQALANMRLFASEVTRRVRDAVKA
jgi:hypothetical protein